MEDTSTPSPLGGARVLDIGRYVTGPFCARLLARLGADVIKVEPPARGDPGRAIGSTAGGSNPGEYGALHLYVDEGKRGITLDLASRTGRNLFLQLAAQADVIVDNFEPGMLAGLGLEYGALTDVNPKIVQTSISVFGATGPYSTFSGDELTVFAMGGHIYRSGQQGRTPLRMGGNPAQYLAAVSAAYVTLLAIRTAERQGLGQHLDFSVLESQVTSHAQAMVEVSYYGEESGARSPRAPAESRRLMAKDGPVMFSVQEQQMGRLAELVGAPRELGRPNPMERAAGRAALQNYITQWAAERSKVEFYTQGQMAHVPASYVASPADLLDSPQYRHRGFLASIHADGRPVQIPGLPFKWEGSQVAPRAAPRLGEHNLEVYGEMMGLKEHSLSNLLAAGVI